MTNILLVGLGGFIGSVLRYLASGAVQQSMKRLDFPYGTLAVNVIGCFVIGSACPVRREVAELFQMNRVHLFLSEF